MAFILIYPKCKQRPTDIEKIIELKVVSSAEHTRHLCSNANDGGGSSEGRISASEPPSKISGLSVFGISPTSIKVSWKLDSGKVDGFYILYRPRSSGEPPLFTSITVLHAAATSYVVNRLKARFFLTKHLASFLGGLDILNMFW